MRDCIWEMVVPSMRLTDGARHVCKGCIVAVQPDIPPADVICERITFCKRGRSAGCRVCFRPYSNARPRSRVCRSTQRSEELAAR